MTSQRPRHLGAAVAAAAFLTASAGLVASSGQEPAAAQQPTGKAADGQPSPDDQVEALVREYDDVRGARMSRPLTRPLAKDREKLRAENETFSKLHKDLARRFLGWPNATRGPMPRSRR